MRPKFARRIAPYVELEILNALRARLAGDAQLEFAHLERAHVIGQEATYWHVKVHVLMLARAIRNRAFREVFGQIFRVAGATTKTAVGWVPQGNTGGANVSPFKRMPIAPELAALIQRAKSDT